MNVPFADLSGMHAPLREEIVAAFEHVYDAGHFIQGEECDMFDREFAAFIGARYALGVATGLDALYVALSVLGIGEGDEVIVPANTFIATALAVSRTGARVVLADPDPITYNMSGAGLAEALTSSTKAIIPVHLYGQAAQMDEVMQFANEHDLFVVEDCAQAHGAQFDGQTVGTFGDFGCFSFYPGKNLGALGDGGALVCNKKEYADKARAFANYGAMVKYHHEFKGTNSRLDEMQAAFLRIKLRHLNDYNTERDAVAKRYLAGMKNDRIVLPRVGEKRNHIWHIFAVMCDDRDALRDHLAQKGIQTNCHYPIAVADQKAYAEQSFPDMPHAEQIARCELSLPLFVGMSDEQVEYVIDAINSFGGC